MSWSQFIIGLVVTLVISTAVYLWQKTVDRRGELRRERRVVYADFVRATLSINERISNFEPTGPANASEALAVVVEAKTHYDQAFVLLSLSASKEVVSCAQKCVERNDEHFVRWRDALRPFLEKDTVRGSDLRAEFKTINRAMRKEFRRDLQSLLSVMRVEEFDGPVLEFKDEIDDPVSR